MDHRQSELDDLQFHCQRLHRPGMSLATCLRQHSTTSDVFCLLTIALKELTITQTLLGYSRRTSFMTAPDGFWVSTSAFPFTANSYWLLAPMTNALFATMAFVVSILAATVYVPVLR